MYKHIIKNKDRINLSIGLRKIAYFIFSVLIKPFIRIESINSEIIVNGEAKVIVANHISYMDPFVIIKAIGKKETLNSIFLVKEKHVSFMSKKMLERLGILTIGENTNESLSKALTTLKEGYSIFIFPEGTRSKSILRFRHVFSFLAYESKANVYPIAISKNKKSFKLNFIDPFTATESHIEDAEIIRSQILERLENEI